MRTVGNNMWVCETWLEQAQHSATNFPVGRGNSYRSANNGRRSLSFRDDVLYSYFTPIAKLEGNVCLVTSQKYSITTSGHMRTLWRASRDLQLQEIAVPYPTGSFESNISIMQGEITVQCEVVQRARSMRLWRLRDLQAKLDSFQAYAMHCKQQAEPQLPDWVKQELALLRLGE